MYQMLYAARTAVQFYKTMCINVCAQLQYASFIIWRRQSKCWPSTPLSEPALFTVKDALIKIPQMVLIPPVAASTEKAWIQ